MQRVVAVENRYITQTTGYAMGSRNMGRLGGNVPQPGIKVTRRVEVTPIYDVCADCQQRIQHGSIKTRLS
jgi:hypothetical protein